MDTNIGYLRDYLREKLRANRLSTDYREGTRVKAFNAKVKPEPIPEHNDPYRFDWTEVEGKPFVVGTEVSLVDGTICLRIKVSVPRLTALGLAITSFSGLQPPVADPPTGSEPP